VRRRGNKKKESWERGRMKIVKNEIKK